MGPQNTFTRRNIQSGYGKPDGIYYLRIFLFLPLFEEGKKDLRNATRI